MKQRHPTVARALRKLFIPTRLCQAVSATVFRWISPLVLMSALFLLWSDTAAVANRPTRHEALAPPGSTPNPVHRCKIPLLHDPREVKLRSSAYYDGTYPEKLTYVEHDEPSSDNVSLFGDHQTWKERDDSFNLKKSMKVHCGFGGKSGVDMHVWDTKYIQNCQYVVASGIFDAYDLPHQPSKISSRSKRLFCFVLLVDEQSLQSITNASGVIETSDKGKWAGIWRLVVLRNLPYDEPRRNGKVPKLLAHRIFPDARYSIWIDGKMELLVDPLLILERYLWRKNITFAIAHHKHSRSIFEEAEAVKRRKRYARPLIDRHMAIYREEGMKEWTTDKLPLISDVPEGAIIIRQHTPLNNLFCCLWFNEVDRFTPRDQLSFGYVVFRLNGSFPFFMFPNCEYNSLTRLHKHTREHSSKVEWVKSLDQLGNSSGVLETRAGLGLFTRNISEG